MAPELTLYGESTWMSPWAFHAMVALEEKGLVYKLEVVPLPMPPELKATLQAKALLGKVPVLVHGDGWISESSAISEYLAETFPSSQGYPRLFPANLVERARARQVMSWLRTSLMSLRNDRPTSAVFTQSSVRPMSDKARVDADELLRVASDLVQPGATRMFTEWSIADADLALALMRMIASGDEVPEHLVAYARFQWERPSVRTYLAHVPAPP